MAIEKIPFPASVPASVSDYQKQNALLMALVKSVDGAQKVVGSNVVQGAVFNVGGALYVATSDTAITGVASDYVKLTPSGDTLTLAPSYVASLSDVAWNAEYKGYYDGSGNLYEFDEAKAYNSGAVLETYKRDKDVAARNIAASGQVSAATFAPSGGITENAITIQRKIIPIGAWNMNSNQSINIAHGLTLSKIRRMSAIIYNDIQTIAYDFNFTAEGYYTSGDQIGITAGPVSITLRRPGWFNNSSYSSTGINRGYISIEYEA